MRDLRWPKVWLGVWFAGWLLAIVLSLLDPTDLPPPPGSDKLGHLLAYAALAAWGALIFRRGWPLAWAALALLVLGCSLELAQGWLTDTRQMEWLDALANSLGVLLGSSLALTRVPQVAASLERYLISRFDQRHEEAN